MIIDCEFQKYVSKLAQKYGHRHWPPPSRGVESKDTTSLPNKWRLLQTFLFYDSVAAILNLKQTKTAMSQRVLIEKEGPKESRIAVVTLNRAEKHNGMDLDMLYAWIDAAKQLAADKTIRGVILKGDGPSFCAGIDVSSVRSSKTQLARVVKAFAKPGKTNDFQQCAYAWHELPIPVVAVLHGNCFGAGFQLAMACDFRFAKPDTQLSIMESKWGLVPDMSGSATFRKHMRLDTVKELAMTGRVVEAKEGLELGMVSRVCEDPEAEARELLAEIMNRSPDAVSSTKALFNRSWLASESLGLALERRLQRPLLMHKNTKAAAARNAGKEREYQSRSVKL